MVKGRGDGTVGMFGWLVVAAIAGWLHHHATFIWMLDFRILMFVVFVIENLASIYLIHILIATVLLCRSLNVLFTNPIWVLVTRMQVLSDVSIFFLDYFIWSFAVCKHNSGCFSFELFCLCHECGLLRLIHIRCIDEFYIGCQGPNEILLLYLGLVFNWVK